MKEIRNYIYDQFGIAYIKITQCNLHGKTDSLQIKSKPNKWGNSKYKKRSSASDPYFVSDGCNRRRHLGRPHKPGSFLQSVPLVLPQNPHW